ncbi:MAG: single-stranded-DNA-specific exonuclease RecJ [Candidatus Komeilibacteria bacterium CG10_big_fil_rev_8_21_14_0_10_41_13]|uniref:Single-stranded-DNA-specific exonuclease RecJ n=1 Tax=Candidatus Komeilibacteria bacterium CG10_big_fil_rev_8_21_14_0_10_41_13 TaxID=1974476 RepID=A0A2M6WD43_9BACT|nr:MAG: single-stranded-DNA-specific exonuclease RecJ [Candidatus Komeilibacteria bacterium CG10_big_fil_rev_8_21_14_0_10_41_13]
MNKYNWQIKELVSEEIKKNFPELQPAVLQLLYDRGLKTQEEIDEFLHPDYSQDIHDPFLFQDMEKAVARIYQTKDKKEKILIYGDYDADGVCGSSILAKVFKKLALNFEVYLPDREKDGYGLNENLVRQFAEQGVKLIITVDCGISNAKEVSLATDLGLEVIITDHHHIPEEVPPALAIIHPGYDKNYPFDKLAGGGVAFKVAQALIRKPQSGLNGEADYYEKWLLDLVAISTVADMVPLVGENRTLAKYGLIVLAKTRNLGLQQLYQVAGIKTEKMEAFTIGFQIAPRINAASRMDHANSAFRLLTTENVEEAITIAHELNKKNQARQSLTEKMVSQAKEQIGEVSKDQPVLFTYGDDWNPGVIGLVASKLTQDFSRPAFALSFDGQKYIASGRSIKEFNLIEGLDKFSDYFIKYGGHSGAAGFSITKEKFEKFKADFSEFAREKLKDIKFIPKLIIDQEISLAEANWDLVEILADFEPFGEGNYRPRFLIKDLKVKSSEGLGQDNKHLRLMVQSGETVRKIICFGFGDLCEALRPGDMIEAVCELGINQWNGNREIQLSLIDVNKIS